MYIVRQIKYSISPKIKPIFKFTFICTLNHQKGDLFQQCNYALQNIFERRHQKSFWLICLQILINCSKFNCISILEGIPWGRCICFSDCCNSLWMQGGLPLNMTHCYIPFGFNTPNVGGAVLQTVVWVINSICHHLSHKSVKGSNI